MIAVRDHIDQLAGALPVVITFATEPDRLADYRSHLDLPFPVLADADKAMYELFGAQRGSIREVWSWHTMRMYAQLLRRGRRLRWPTEDTRQLGADAIIDRSGRLHRLWLPPGPSARPPISEVAAAVASVPDAAPS